MGGRQDACTRDTGAGGELRVWPRLATSQLQPKPESLPRKGRLVNAPHRETGRSSLPEPGAVSRTSRACWLGLVGRSLVPGYGNLWAPRGARTPEGGAWGTPLPHHLPPHFSGVHPRQAVLGTSRVSCGQYATGTPDHG